MAHRYQKRVSGRRPRRPAPSAAAIKGTGPAVTLERVLALPAIDRLLGRALRHPRLMQWLGALAGLVIVAFALRPLFVQSAISVVVTPAVQATGSATALPITSGAGVEQRGTSSGEAELVAVVAAYNQASITAALLGRADVMAPYLAPDGTAWAEVQAEYQRRATKGERHDPALTRWGILRTEMSDATATVETQEQWDDIVSLGGQVISSRRGILTRTIYELRRSSAQGRWVITDISSTPIIE